MNVDNQLIEILDKSNLKLKFTFVPFNVSRNRHEIPYSINWIVHLYRDGSEVFSIEYTQGAGHIPYYKYSNFSIIEKEYFRDVCISGRYHKSYKGSYIGLPSYTPNTRLSEPLLSDIMYSLLMDIEGLQDGFFEWAENMGLNSDSIKCKKIFEDCQNTQLILSRILSKEQLSAMSTILEDY